MKNIKLFDYQEDMKERIEKALRLHRSVMAQMPTGTGKTVLLASVVESFLREHSNCNVWIVAHRRELVSQIRETIQRVFSKPHPSSLTIKEDFSNHPVNSSKITPSLFTLKEGSTSHPDPLTLRGEGGNRPTRCSEPLRSKVGGPSKVSPDCAGWDRLGATCLRAGDGLTATCLRPTEGLGDRLGERGGDGLGATSASSVNPTSDMMPIKAVSMQWLSKHYDEIEEEPGMIVIDEAHHALAKTYKEMWERFPNAKFLGLTATPCRLNGKGFTDLFDVLVQSWSVPEFISKGRLATYDFVSIKSDGVTQRLIDSLQKRGADGDYQNKEMDMLLNKKPSIERLYQSLEEYGKDRKGIVYAINIRHANAIAEFYREHGIAAVAIDSKTPSSLRKELIERFKASSFSSSNHQPSILHKDLSNHPDKSSKITPSLFTIKEGSTSHPDPLTLRGEGGNRPTRCSEPLRSKDGGPSKVSPDCAGWDRLGATCLRAADKVGDRLGATCLRAADGVGDRLAATCLRAADGVGDGLAPIQVLVNVDIFSEGFDCPDVEFVQLARPTLSLAKYLQMVGRGLRVAKGKKNCVIIDNVGLYRVFGLPSQVWNWNAMFEGKLKVGKRKETPKDREFFLMNEKQDDIQIHPDSEMMMVMSHEELLQTIQYREFVDSKGEFAIIKLSDGKMTVVNRQGEQVLEPGDYYDMKLLDGNILFYRPRRKAKCYYDLLAKAVIDDGTNVAETPHVVNIKGWEFIEYNDIFMSRTHEDFSLPYHPSQYDFLNYGYYMIFRFRPSAPGCQVWYYCEGDEGKMRMSNEESRNVCFLRNDYEHVYWLCAVLYGERIVVMDSKEDYYLVDSNLKKTYIGCNHPKNENEDLNFVMPRLGKKYYHEAMLQKKEMEANEMLLLHEKSEAGHVELYQAGKKWGVKVDGKVIVPPLYCSIAQPVGAYCAFEEIPRHWGVMTLKGKVIVDAKYEKVEIRDNGIAVVTGITGKTQTINLLKVKG
ncbi:DEAD/DEAH box helicase family protein [Segatella copri]|uniref:DEAD/DEAH box helicase family protein n=1 Tax=Segatella copri TaxID=165179 RepID=UPI002915DEC4|nr:DEAD/DEAH box helicase family protein [Segatella copri]MDV3121762.1 DEAD/DEAH box helicase family protein [Segatella copri]